MEAPTTWVVAAAVTAGALTGQILAGFTVRRGFTWRLVMPFVAGGLVGLPLGLALLSHLDAVRFRAGVGALLALWCPLMLLSAGLPRLSFGGRWAYAAAGACGGFMGPLGGFTSVIPTLWCSLRGLERDALRAVIQNLNLAMLAATLASYLAGGIVTRPMLPLMAVVAPALVART